MLEGSVALQSNGRIIAHGVEHYIGEPLQEGDVIGCVIWRVAHGVLVRLGVAHSPGIRLPLVWFPVPSRSPPRCVHPRDRQAAFTRNGQLMKAISLSIWLRDGTRRDPCALVSLYPHVSAWRCAGGVVSILGFGAFAD